MNYLIRLVFSILISNICFSFNPAHSSVGTTGKPILVLATVRDFGLYSGQILKAEGFNEFQLDSFASGNVTSGYLKQFDVVILAERSLTPAGRKLIRQYVKEGGNLIALRPDKKLSPVFGIADAKGFLSEGYIAIDEKTAVGKGLTAETLQYHGTADKYNLAGGQSIATLYSNSVTSTGLPAVVMNDYGKGHTVAFLFNLPESIVYTRQGNYRDAGKEMDGIPGIRAMDLFTGGWVDVSRNGLNQADEEMRLLSHCIEKMSGYTKPLARLWYFPDSLKCLVVLNNDGEDSKESEFETQFEAIEAKGAKMTLYIKDVDKVSKAWVDKWISVGAEISGHPDDTKEAVSPTWAGMNNALGNKINDLRMSYDVPKMRTIVNHWFVWCGRLADSTPDFAAQARLEANHGIELDANYAHYDNNATQHHFLGATGAKQGNFNGSGLPMKFADRDGAIINIYQLLNNVYDQQYMENRDPDGFYACFKELVDKSLDSEVYSFVTVKSHNDEWYFSALPVSKMLDYSKGRAVPVWTAQKLADFLEAKDEASFNDLKWSGHRLSFEICSSVKGGSGLGCMLPYVYYNRKVDKIMVDGVETPFFIRSVKGVDYAMINVMPGKNYIVNVGYADQK